MILGWKLSVSGGSMHVSLTEEDTDDYTETL